MWNNYTKTNILFNVFRHHQEFITYQADIISGTTEYQPERIWPLSFSSVLLHMLWRYQGMQINLLLHRTRCYVCIKSFHFKVYSKSKTIFCFQLQLLSMSSYRFCCCFLASPSTFKVSFFFFLCDFIIDYIHKHIWTSKFLGWAKL